MRRASLFAIIFVLLASSFAILTPTRIQALSGDFYKLTLDEQIRVWAYNGWIRGCIANSKAVTVTPDGLGPNGVVFDSLGIIGPYINADYSSGCGSGSTSAELDKAISVLGFKNRLDLLCSAGYTRDKDGSGSTAYEKCMNGSGGMSRADSAAMLTAYDKVVNTRFSKAPNLSKAALYKFYQRTFIEGCVAKPVADSGHPGGVYTPPDATYDALASDTQKYASIITVGQTSPADTKKRTLYLYEKGAGANIEIASPYNNTVDNLDGGFSPSCSTLIKLANAYADDYKKYVDENLGDKSSYQETTNSQSQSGAASAEPTCAIDAIGWIVCPVFNFMAKVTDASYGIVETMLLVRMPDATTNEGKSLYASWGAVRNLANISFIIAFLIIIYSQITGMGINNYGIKRMLPRLIVAAILVNISYWVCAAAVEATNIVGASIKGLIDNAGNAALPTGVFEDSQTGGGWTGIAGTALVATGAVFVTFAVALPLLLSTFLVILGVVIALTLRQALIYLLIVISPLAFVAYLLPNTEGLFKKWFGLFKTLLLMFPIVAFVFAGSALASKILTGVAQGSPLLAAMAAGVAILPLIVVPTLIKTSSSVIGKFMNNNPTKGLIDRSKRGLENRGKRYDEQLTTKALNSNSRMSKVFGGRARSRVRKGLRDKSVSDELAASEAGFSVNDPKASGYSQQQSLSKLRSDHFGDAKQDALLERLQKDDAFRLAAAGGDAAAADRLASRTDTQVHKRRMDDANALVSGMRVDEKSLSNRQKLDLIGGKDVLDSSGNVVHSASSLDTYSRQALIAEAGKIASVPEGEELMAATSGMDSVTERRAVVSAIGGNSSLTSKAPHLTGKSLGDAEQGTFSIEAAAQRAARDGNIRPEQLASTDVNSAKTLLEAAQKTDYGSKERAMARSMPR